MSIGNNTTIPSGKDIQRKWFVIDAAGKTLGRLSTVAASMMTMEEWRGSLAIRQNKLETDARSPSST